MARNKTLAGEKKAAREQGERELSRWVVVQALNRLKGFKYVVGVVAALVLLASVGGLLYRDVASAVIGLTFLFLFAFVLVLLERAQSHLNGSGAKTLVITMMWAISALFLILGVMGVVYVGTKLFPATELSVEERALDGIRGDYLNVRGDMEAAMQYPASPVWPSIATRAGDIVSDLTALPDESLSPGYRISKYRLIGSARLIECISGEVLAVAAWAERCKAAVVATSRSLELIEQADKKKLSDRNWRAAAEWARSSRLRDRSLRDLAVQNALLFRAVQELKYADAACRAVTGISAEYAAVDPVEDSTILAGVVAERCLGVRQVSVVQGQGKAPVSQ